MTSFTLALTEPCWEEIRAALALGVESAAVIAARVVDDRGGEVTLLGRSITWVPEHSYVQRAPDELVIDSTGWVPAVARAGADNSAAVFVHTHPSASARPSERDCGVDTEIAATLRARTRQGVYAHLVVGGTPESPVVEGRALGAEELALRCVRVVGSRLQIFLPEHSSAGHGDLEHPSATFDRHVRALGLEGQRVLRALHVGVVGAGGTGSAVIDQLARLGVGRVTVVDPKTLTSGNVTRVHGSGIADVGRPKVEVMADHVERVGLGTRLEPVHDKVTKEDAARRLRHCDVVVACTDDNAGRVVLSRLGYWYLMSVLDLGVLIETSKEQITGVFGRLTVTGPGAACLLCRGRVDLRRARAEALDADERERLAKEGYVAGLDEPDPAVVPFTTYVAAAAMSELLQRLFAYGPPATPSEQVLRIDRRRLGMNTAVSREGCYCVDPEVLAAGDTVPLLDLTWT